MLILIQYHIFELYKINIFSECMVPMHHLDVCICNANESFYSESLAAGSLDQLPAPLEHILADA